MRRHLLVAVSLLAALPAQDDKPGAPVPSLAALSAPPRGFPPLVLPGGAAPTPAVFELGRRLFADPILSIDRTVACQSCHQPSHGFAHPDPFPPGIPGHRAKRHAPTLVNRAWGKSQRWDGSTPTLEEFVLQPIADPDEMGFQVAAAVERLRQEPTWRDAFAAAFGEDATQEHLSTALASFVRGIVVGDGPVDRFHRGEVQALPPAARTGLWIFESKGGCWKCHPMPLFTDESFHNTGVGVKDGVPEPGRAAATGDAADTGRFKTPTLRGLRFTAPYMHDGSLPTLEAVVDFYARGGNDNPHKDERVQPIELSEQDRQALVAYLRTL